MNSTELIITVIGIVIILYFWLKPKSGPKPEDELTNPIQVDGLPPSYPTDAGGDGGGK